MRGAANNFSVRKERLSDQQVMSVLVGQTRNVGGQLYVEVQLLKSPCKSCYDKNAIASRIVVGHYPRPTVIRDL